MAKKIRPEKTESGYYRQSTRVMDDGSTGYNRPVRTAKGVLAGAARVDEARENRESRANTTQPKSAKPYMSTPREDAKAAKYNAKRYGDFKDITPGAYITKEKKGGPITALDQVQDMYSKMYSKKKK
jgi:hypothetical protein